MSDDLFRLVIALAVVVACIAFVVQALVAFALYKAIHSIQLRTETLAGKFEPLFEQSGPVIQKVGPMIERAGPVLERLGPMLDRAGQTMEHFGPAIDGAAAMVGRIGKVAEQTGPVLESAQRVLANANQVVLDSRPRIAEFSDEAVAVAHSARKQVERVEGLLNDVSDRAKARVEQIDHSVESTVEQVGQVGDAVKRAVMRPVREASGLAAGISAAVSTLVKHPHKSSPDKATQDEEMFI